VRGSSVGLGPVDAQLRSNEPEAGKIRWREQTPELDVCDRATHRASRWLIHRVDSRSTYRASVTPL